eukprot:TRINITY_DN1825_c1_g1_i1.p1 TRINITY_DN1825_c1_g1~~TRINITY_DN1825_c1_g1_i1.p1  ORF type:complete len:754 (+),score=182.30 TRINITY_DN1825_c1_g1_i1:28-2262(+)
MAVKRSFGEIDSGDRVVGNVAELIQSLGLVTVPGPSARELADALGPRLPMRQVRKRKWSGRATRLRQADVHFLDIDELIHKCEAEGNEDHRQNNTETLTLHGGQVDEETDETYETPSQEKACDQSSSFSSEDEEEEEEEVEKENEQAAATENAKVRSGFESSDEGSSDDEEAEVVGEHETDEMLICGLSASRYHLPPDPSRQPNMVLVLLEKGDEMVVNGFNARCLVLKGAICTCLGVAAEREWFMAWGGEVPYGVTIAPTDKTSEGHDTWQGDHPLLVPKPTEEEYRWALSTAEHVSSKNTACILMCAANRSTLLQYHHSYHPSPTPQLLGNIMDRLRHVANIKPLCVPDTLLPVLSGAFKKIVLVGSANTGKSTLSRLIANSLKRAVYLDTDVGQPEFASPGCVSLTLVKSLLLGPGYTHLPTESETLFVGHTSVQPDPFAWLSAVSELVRKYNADSELSQYPLIVNTHGWCSGLGLRCISELLQLVRPDAVVNTGGVGSFFGGDRGEDDTQSNRVLGLFDRERGFVASYNRYYHTSGAADGVALGKMPEVVMCEVEGQKSGASKGWWSRQVLLTSHIFGDKINNWAGSRTAEGHAMIRDFVDNSHPVMLDLSQVWIYDNKSEWGEHLPDPCTPPALLIKLRRKVICMAHAAVDAPPSGMNILSSPPLTHTFIGLAYVVTTSPSHLYIITSVPPHLQHTANLLLGSLEAPASWAATTPTPASDQPLGKAIPQGRHEKRKKHS